MQGPGPHAPRDERIDYMLDRTEIFDLIRYERLCRDIRDWDGLVKSYVPGAPVRTSWFDGTIEEFAEASRQKMEKGGSQGAHWIMPTKLKLNKPRATVESPAFIYDRLTFEGVEFDFFAFVRFFSKVLLTDDGWKLVNFEGIYNRDYLRAVNPSDKLPVNWDEIATYRKSYRHMGWTQAYRGYHVNPELIGDDRPDLVQAFYAEADHWLETGEEGGPK